MTTPAFPTPQDLADIQGDVVLGFPKRVEDFIFFTITDVANFKKHLKVLIPTIGTTADVQKMRKDINDHKSKGHDGLLKVVGINIGFTASGLKKLGVTDSIGDPAFDAGQLNSAKALGDPVDGNSKPLNWLPEFLNEIDFVVLVAGDSEISLLEGIAKVELTLGFAVKQVLKVAGNVRPGKEKGHEHFGFLDGISFPCIPTLNGPLLPGQQQVDPGVLICGQPGDNDASGQPVQRPAWAKNGSILAYRQLQQLVPEFDKFLADNPIPEVPDRKLGSELLGARFFGRWKSGAPTDITPTQDDPALAADPQRNNNFDFSDAADQSRCPFAAHVRKTNPRSDLKTLFGNNAVAQHMIMRQGIPYGPEVTPQETKDNKTEKDRGLAFTCYQSNLANGFEFVQEKWANATGFPPQKPVTPGFDPIIGQNGTGTRTLSGTDPNAQSNELTLPFDFVVSKGGAYFFLPSISALKTTITA